MFEQTLAYLKNAGIKDPEVGLVLGLSLIHI